MHLITAVALVAIFYLMLLSRRAFQKISARGATFAILLIQVKQRITMTLGMLVVFGVLYVLLIWISPQLLSKESLFELLAFGRAHPSYLFYAALLTVVLHAFLICIVRSFLKKLFIKLKM